MNDKPLATTYADLLDDGADPSLALLIEDLDALYTAPSPPANIQARFDHLLRQRAQPASNGRVEPVTGAIPPVSSGAIPAAHPEPIPLPDRTGPRARLRQIAGIAAALFVFVLVAIMVAQLFGSASDDGPQAVLVDVTPTLKDTVGEILYVGFPENQSQERSTFALFVARADGSGVRQITKETQALVDSASWSPDGSHILYSVIDGQQSALYVIDADGGNSRMITEGLASALSADWSPDGSQIAFVGSAWNERDVAGIYIVNAGGTELRRLSESDNGTDPRWSPDGSRIAFLQWRVGESTSLVVINADGTERHRLELPFDSVSYPDWSPDGARIAFMGNSAIFVIDVDGSNLTQLTHGPSDWSPRWSPDGLEIAFTSQNSRLRLVQADGSGDRVLVEGAGIVPAWSPDGSQIAVIVGGQLSVVNRDGSGLRALADNIFSLKQQVSWRLVPADTEDTVTTPSPTPTPSGTPPSDPSPTPEPTPTVASSSTPVDISEAAISAAIAALPEDERGCGATQVITPNPGVRGNEVRGTTVIGDAELWLQYFTLNDDSPTVIRAGHTLLSYWTMGDRGAAPLSVRLDNLSTGSSAVPDWGPTEGDSAWRDRAWRMMLTFPDPGCWQATVTRGDSVGVLWLDVQPSMDDLATPVTTVEQFTSAVAPHAPGAGRSVTLQVSADYRMDEGALHDWTVTIRDRTNDAGRQQRRMDASDSDGNRVAWFVRDGDVWQWWQRGWFQTGTISSGLVALPEELRLADSSLDMMLATFGAATGLDLIAQSQDGELSVTRYSVPDAESLSEMTGIEVSSSRYDVWLDANGVPVRARWAFVAPDGLEATLADVVIRDHALYSASTYDDALFELPATVGIARFYWDWSPLPHGLTMEHDSTQTGGPPTGSETLTITGDGVTLRLEVFPSRGGHDWRLMAFAARESDDLFPTISDTRVGPVTWLTRPGEGWPIRAVWDDGTYRFELSGDMPGWTERDLVALVEALSASSLR